MSTTNAAGLIRCGTPSFISEAILNGWRGSIIKMRFTLLIVTMLMAIMSVMSYRAPVRRPRPGHVPVPTFPGAGPYNPKIPRGPWGRPKY
ncbi:hypothetical protein KPH14_008640 [Odynerus spinipes]|uniref:Uncharacterized protein n=1 Tax=Odynerus spinipes TaxID=1348599 RepID=A0AAD9RSY5_9HYME|nr:hypothetical protein KPH14_008640 [Odynerus spinipes]